MNIKCNKNVIYSRREFCIGVQERMEYICKILDSLSVDVIYLMFCEIKTIKNYCLSLTRCDCS